MTKGSKMTRELEQDCGRPELMSLNSMKRRSGGDDPSRGQPTMSGSRSASATNKNNDNHHRCHRCRDIIKHDDERVKGETTEENQHRDEIGRMKRRREREREKGVYREMEASHEDEDERDNAASDA